MKEKPLQYTFEDIFDLVGSLVKISHLHNIEPTIGKVAVVDPESLAVVLAVKSGIRVVIRSAVLSIDQINADSVQDFLSEEDVKSIENNLTKLESKVPDFDKESKGAHLDEKIIIDNRRKVIEILKKEKLVFSEDTAKELILVLNCVQIHKPFLSSSCYSANELILSRVQKLLRSLEI